ncbi:MAG: hypothetical protein K0Q99_1340 [Clostridia bacterium]|nr:hypothetical protein [Clostridia bacterium]
MKILIHDLDANRFKERFPSIPDNVKIVACDDTMHHCIGCFGCWTKTPGTCVIRDEYGDMGEQLSKCSEVILLSKCFYGGFSPSVKKAMDRGISYNHPYFVYRNGEMHHRGRYNNHFELKVWFYGENITENEKQTAEKLIKANAINMDCSGQSVTFVHSIDEIKDFAL